MPSDWLTVPHFRQSRDGRCLPACARMVLAYLGHDYAEEDLARLPCIIFLKTEILPHWQIEDAHAVVLVGLADETVYINDPAFDGAPVSVPLQNFLLAWSEFDYEYAVIERP